MQVRHCLIVGKERKSMKNKEYSIAINWSYVGISVVVFSILTLLVLYLPSMREIDSTILNSIRSALSPRSQVTFRYLYVSLEEPMHTYGRRLQLHVFWYLTECI